MGTASVTLYAKWLGPQWSHQAYLKAPNNSDNDTFGLHLSISGDTIAVGANCEDSTTTSIINGSNLSSTNDSGNQNGAVYVFTRSGTTWSHQAYLKAPNNSNSDYFGNSVSISGDTIAVGTGFEDSTTTSIINGSDLSSTNDSGNSNGAVYVFTRSGTTWSHQAYLKAPNSSNEDYFGESVSVYGDTIAVGAYGEDSTTTSIINDSDLSSTNDSGYDNGAVYVFTRSGTTWSHQAYLKAPNNSNTDHFGDSVSLSGDTIAVGANLEDSTTTSIINDSNLSSTNDSGGSNGAVYVFTRTGSTWSHQAYLKAPNNSNNDYFGDSVSISGDTIAVGSPREDSTTTSIINGSNLSSTNNGGSSNGAVYVFTRSGTSWSHQAYLKALNNSDTDEFGESVSVYGDTIAVGAPGEDSTRTSIINGSDLSSTNNNGSNNGSVYVFTRSGTTWSHQAYLKAPNNAYGETGNFGVDISVYSDTIAVGAHLERSTSTSIINGSDLSDANCSGAYNGAVYVFTRQ